MRRILWIGIGLGVASQATGINTVNYYAPTILKSAGLGTNAALVLTVAVGVVGVIGTILLGHVNRRRMVRIGYVGVAAGHLLLALMFLLPESPARAYLIPAAAHRTSGSEIDVNAFIYDQV
jgi:major inositol transporter-like SP family MFS transporter